MKTSTLAALAAALALAGCGGPPPPPPQSFPVLDYSYLPPIVLKVANLTVVNNYVPTPDAATLIGQDPEPPAVAALTMLGHRIVASGTPGSATVTLQNAAITETGNTLNGAMTVDVSVTSPDGRSTGFAEASVTASGPAPDPDADPNTVQAALYGMTKQLMDAMNVQLQYQIQHNMSAWLSGLPGAAPLGAGAAPSPGAIQATPLTPPGGATTTTTTTSTPAPPPGTPNSNPAVPNYLPGAGPAVLTPPPALQP